MGLMRRRGGGSDGLFAFVKIQVLWRGQWRRTGIWFPAAATFETCITKGTDGSADVFLKAPGWGASLQVRAGCLVHCAPPPPPSCLGSK